MPEELMAQPVTESEDRRRTIPRWVFVAALLGLYLTLRGYHSRDGDQAYRLPLLLHQQSPSLYEDDPFVRAFDQFNPHRGAFLVLDTVSRPLGLSAGLFLLFVLTFLATFLGADRLARATWPDAGTSVGLLAFVLFLTAKAGNIGTNHLFESMLLDRLQAFALGWVAIAGAVCSGTTDRLWIAPLALGLATLIHPSAGLQLAMTLAIAWPAWAIAGRWTNVGWGRAALNVGCLGLSVLPGLRINAGSSGSLLNGLSPDDYWTLAVELQSPQHMLPHLWWMHQWLAWGCYLVLAGLALIGEIPKPYGKADSSPARTRLALMLGVILVGLAGAWFGIEVLHDIRITVFQPFRMATIARGIALILISGHVMKLWRRQETLPRLRAALILVGLTGDWLMVVVTTVEVAAWGIGFVRSEMALPHPALTWKAAEIGFVSLLLGLGLRFLSRHDTESGHIPLLMTVGLVGLAGASRAWRWLDERTQNWVRSRKKASILTASFWIVPILAMIVGLIPAGHPLARRPEVHALIGRCRFAETPDDDIERLAAWCRVNTPETARFIGPPGPKTFRLWSRRSLAFNRASSPYHASGLADWFSRFRDHVGFAGSADQFVRAYTRNRHGIESRYQTLTPTERTQLAIRQGATHIVAVAPSKHEVQNELELLHVEGKYAVYRIAARGTVPFSTGSSISASAATSVEKGDSPLASAHRGAQRQR